MKKLVFDLSEKKQEKTSNSRINFLNLQKMHGVRSSCSIFISLFSKYSELHSDKDDDPKELIDRFLKFSQELDHAIIVAQSQTRLRHPKACCSNPTSLASPRAATKAALDRKQSAISWVRAAMEADLSPFSSHARGASESARASSVAESKPVSPLFCSKPKCNCNSRVSKKTADASTEGSNLNAAMDLAIAMRSDVNRWLLKYIDKFLDDIQSDYAATCDSQVAGFLQQLKKVDDWLNRVVRHERMFSIDRSSKDSVLSEEEESDACERVRRKIYAALLRHVQFAAMALEGINSVTDEEKEL